MIGPFVFAYLFTKVPNDEEAKFRAEFVQSLDRSASGSLYLRYDYRNFCFYLFLVLFYGDLISLFSNSTPDSLRQPGIEYLMEDVSDMILALGEKRSELCLSRLHALCAIDPDVLAEEWKLNWFPFSLNRLDEDDYEDDVDEDSLRIVNYSELARMLRVSMTANFSLVSPTEGSSFNSHSCMVYNNNFSAVFW